MTPIQVEDVLLYAPEEARSTSTWHSSAGNVAAEGDESWVLNLRKAVLGMPEVDLKLVTDDTNARFCATTQAMC